MARTITRKLYASSTSTTNDLAHIDIPFAAKLVGMDLTAIPTAVATGDHCTFELSTASVAQTGTSDAQGVLGYVGCGTSVVTSGASAAANKYIGPVQISMPAGSRIYVHSTQQGTSATRIMAILHLEV